MREGVLKLVGTLPLCSLASAATCYNIQGEVDSLAQVCDPSAQISACCHASDYCLTNGLCLNAGANNFLGVQGCTDRNWGSPCLKVCPNSSESRIFSPNVFPCPPSTDTQTWCCGPNATDCCRNGAGFGIPVGQISLRADQMSASVTLSTTSITPINSFASPTSSVVTSTASASTGLPSTATSGGGSSTWTPSSDTSPSKKSLAIALGVGIPLGVLFTAALAFLAWELRRYNNNRIAAGQPASRMIKGEPRVIQMEELDGQNQEEFDRSNRLYGNGRQAGELDAANQIHELRH